VDSATEGLAALQHHDWERAAALLRQALVLDPTSVKLHYGLAISASHLARRDEAIREFQWILANASAGSPEAQTARQWLTEAGIMPGPARMTTESTPDETVGESGIRGRVRSASGDQPVSGSRLQLFLKGLPGTSTAGRQYVLRTDPEGRFEFKRIPVGTYKLTNRVAGRPVWRLRVELPSASSIDLDLSSENSVEVRDDFPDDGR
jgi:hypothetical protein